MQPSLRYGFMDEGREPQRLVGRCQREDAVCVGFGTGVGVVTGAGSCVGVDTGVGVAVDAGAGVAVETGVGVVVDDGIGVAVDDGAGRSSGRSRS